MFKFFYLIFLKVKYILKYILKICVFIYKKIRNMFKVKFINTKEQDQFKLNWIFFKLKRSNLNVFRDKVEMKRYNKYIYRVNFIKNYEYRSDIRDDLKSIREIFRHIRLFKKYKRKRYSDYEILLITQKKKIDELNIKYLFESFFGFLKVKNLNRFIVKNKKPISLSYFSYIISEYFFEIYLFFLIFFLFFFSLYIFNFINENLFFFLFKKYNLIDNFSEFENAKIFRRHLNIDLNNLSTFDYKNKNSNVFKFFDRGPIKLDLDTNHFDYFALHFSKKFQEGFLLPDELAIITGFFTPKSSLFYPKYIPTTMGKYKSMFGLMNNKVNDYEITIWLNRVMSRYLQKNTNFNIYNFLDYYNTPKYKKANLFLPESSFYIRDNFLDHFFNYFNLDTKYEKNIELDNYYIREYLNKVNEYYSIKTFKSDFLIDTCVTDSFLSDSFQEKISLMENFYKKTFNFIFKIYSIKQLYFCSFINLFNYIHQNNLTNDSLMAYINQVSRTARRCLKKTYLNQYYRDVKYRDVTIIKNTKDFHMKTNFQNGFLEYDFRIFLKLYLLEKKENFINSFDYYLFINFELWYLNYVFKRENYNSIENYSKNFFIEQLINFSLIHKINIVYYRLDFLTDIIFDYYPKVNTGINKNGLRYLYNFYERYNKGSAEGIRLDRFMYYYYYKHFDKILFPYTLSELEIKRFFLSEPNKLALILDLMANMETHENKPLSELEHIESPRYVLYDTLFTDEHLFVKNLDLNFRIPISNFFVFNYYDFLYDYTIEYQELNKIIKMLKNKKYLNLFELNFDSPFLLNNLILKKFNLLYFHLTYKIYDKNVKYIYTKFPSKSLWKDCSIKYLYKDFSKNLYANFNIFSENNIKYIILNKSFFSFLLSLNLIDRKLKFEDCLNFYNYNYRHYFEKFFYSKYLVNEKKNLLNIYKYFKDNLFNLYYDESIFYHSYVYHRNMHRDAKYNMNSNVFVNLINPLEKSIPERIHEFVLDEKENDEYEYMKFIDTQTMLFFGMDMKALQDDVIFYYKPFSFPDEHDEIRDKTDPILETNVMDFLIYTSNVNDNYKIAQSYDRFQIILQYISRFMDLVLASEDIWGSKPFVKDKVYKSEMLLRNYWLRNGFRVKLLKLFPISVYDFDEKYWKWFFKEDNKFYKNLLLMLFTKNYNTDVDYNKYYLFSGEKSFIKFENLLEVCFDFNFTYNDQKYNNFSYIYYRFYDNIFFDFEAPEIENPCQNFLYLNYEAKDYKFGKNNIMYWAIN